MAGSVHRSGARRVRHRKTGAIRRLTLARRTGSAAVSVLLCLPLLIGLGASNADPVELESLRLANESLRIENDSYRAATGELAEQIASLQSALTQLSDQAQLDPAAKQALQKLPAVIRSRAAGGSASASTASVGTSDSTLGVLKGLLGALEHRLAFVKTKVENEQALARATPSIWPLAGWLSSGYGHRRDPVDGTADFHPGIDIAANKGIPVRATADGTVQVAGYQGNYGNAVLVEHGFGISTRFGHLSGFTVRPGQRVQRGTILGFVGSTGRVTGSHLHYEILLNGRAVNPLQLLAKP
jgi:murein DD-endopeptidase MepM/ murein hydrolase activator NlpD